MTREAFIKELTTAIPPPPQYFFHDVSYNKGKTDPVNDILKKALNFEANPNFEELERQGVIVLDTRSPTDFGAGYIHGAICVPLTMNFAIWAGTLFPPGSKFFIISDAGKERESVMRLMRIGYDHCVGILDGGMDAYRASGKPVETMKSIAFTEVTADLPIFDVRNPGEFL